MIIIITEIFKYMLWVIADYWGTPVTNIALQGRGGVSRPRPRPGIKGSVVVVGGRRPL